MRRDRSSVAIPSAAEREESGGGVPPPRFLAVFAARNDTLLVGAKHVLLFSSSQRLKKFGELSLLADKFIKFFKVLVSRRLGEVDNL